MITNVRKDIHTLGSALGAILLYGVGVHVCLGLLFSPLIFLAGMYESPNEFWYYAGFVISLFYCFVMLAYIVSGGRTSSNFASEQWWEAK